MPRLSLLLACLSVFLAPVPRAWASGDGGFALVEIAPGVYVHYGQYADLDGPARGDSANIGFVAGERCVAVIDSGGAVATGTALASAIEAAVALPVCYVVNTHVHFDHVLGNAAFRGAEFVGHRELADAIEANRAFFAESFAPEIGGDPAQVIGPGIGVDSTLELDLGNRVLVVTAVPPAHTTTDVTVLDRRTNTLWAGDLVFRERMPVLDGSLRGWLAWLDGAMARSYAHVIPGHGPVDEAWPDGARDLARYLRALLDGTRAAIAAGAFIDEAKDRVAVEERGRWLLSERAHRLNISRAYRELEWE